MDVIGFGLGRTGTLSLKLALERLGFGPCHHMAELFRPELAERQVALWRLAAEGRPDWAAIYDGYRSAVDWPTAGFVRELAVAYPEARFLLTVRSPESWAESYGATIGRLMSHEAPPPPERRAWTEMAQRVLERTGVPPTTDAAALARFFVEHGERVRAAVPPERLLVFQVRDGWGPLCDFLGVPEPEEAFPRRNDRAEFWEAVPTEVAAEAGAA